MTGVAKPNHFDAPMVPFRADRRQKGGDPAGPVAIVSTGEVGWPSEFVQLGPAHAVILHQAADRIWIAQSDSCRGPEQPSSAPMPRSRIKLLGRGNASSLNVERLGAGGLAVGIGGDLVNPCLRLPQQLLASSFQRLAAFVDRDRFLERYLALLEPLHDRFQLPDRALEAQLLDVHLGVFGHVAFPNTQLRAHDSRTVLRTYCGGIHPPINAVTWAATDSFRPCRS